MSNSNLLRPTLQVCQDDYPLDWYQKEFMPYAEEYQALPDRDIFDPDATSQDWEAILAMLGRQLSPARA